MGAMLSYFNQTFEKISKKNIKHLITTSSKPFIILGLFLYWGLILLGTFIQLS